MVNLGYGRSEIGSGELLSGTVSIMTAFLQRSKVDADHLGDVIKGVHDAMIEAALSAGATGEVGPPHPSDSNKIERLPAQQFKPVTPVPVSRPSPAPKSLARKPRRVRSELGISPIGEKEMQMKPLETQKEIGGAFAVVEDEKVAPSTVSPAPVEELHLEAVPPAPATVEAVLEVAGFRRQKPRTLLDNDDAVKQQAVLTSVRMKAIVCLEDGARVADLAAHLWEKHGMSPDEYRAKWGLSPSYPMHSPESTLKRGDQFEIDPVTKAFIPLHP